ncbi:MAG: 50S ribosomal protein L23 [Candidatus Moraniibacteriota bacterium]|nr:MAG: 50S ribosomal protein L23 [Candidatus Moranbacteria bacterium]
MATPTPKKESVRDKALATAVLLRPRITEKAYAVNALNQYVFQVAPRATKTTIKKAIEAVYGVTVVSVNVTKLPGKKKNMGRRVGQRSAVRKAVVRLKAGDSITLFQAGL